MLDGEEAAFESFFNGRLSGAVPLCARAPRRRRGRGRRGRAGRHLQGDREAAHISAAKPPCSPGCARSAAARFTPTASATRSTRTSSSPRTSRRFAPRSNRCALRRSRTRTRCSIAPGSRAFVQRVLDQLPSHYADALEWKYIDEAVGAGHREPAGSRPQGRRIAADASPGRVSRGVPHACPAAQPPLPGPAHGEG